MRFVFTLTFLTASSIIVADEAQVRVSETEQGFLFTEESTKVLFYQRQPKSLAGRYERAHYVHPLYDLEGGVLTEDFPKDHLHHRGIFWAWHQLQVGDKKAGDPWLAKDFLCDVVEAKAEHAKDGSAALTTRVHWISSKITNAAGKPLPLVEEITTIRAHKAQDNARNIDFEIRLLALQEKVRIGGAENVKGYGGFSPRFRLPSDVRFVGQLGELAPLTTSMKGGAWVDVTGAYGPGKATSGVAILCHPSLPGFPQRWILRRSHSMQNPVFPGREAVALSQEKPLVLRYRLVVHRGGTDRQRVERWQRKYAN